MATDNLLTNPDVPTHWIKRRLMDGGEATVFYSNASDNTHNPDDYIDTLNSLSGVLHGLALGQWAQAEGVVYEDWNEAIHVIDPFPIPSYRRRFRVVDFGIPTRSCVSGGQLTRTAGCIVTVKST